MDYNKQSNKKTKHFKNTVRYWIDLGYRVDFYHKETKTVVEFYGDFYHRNPALFESNHIAFGTTAKEKWDYDRIRENKIQQDKNVKQLLVVWDSEFRKNSKETVNKIIKEIL